LGGYVKMAGEQPDDERSGANDEFLSKTKWQRFQVLIAGPLMNVLLAIVVLAGVLYQGADVPLYEDEPAVVGSVAPDSPADRAGVQVGDRIVSIDGVQTPTWDDVFMYVVPKANREITLRVERAGQMTDVRLTPEAVSKWELGEIGVQPVSRLQLTLVSPGGPADRGGLKVRDVLLAVDGHTEITPQWLTAHLQASTGREVEFRVRREGAEQLVTVVPEEGALPVGIGWSLYETKLVQPGLFEAIGMSVQRNWEGTKLIATTLV